MGQVIATILTKEKISVPASTVHFVEQGVTIIVMNWDPTDVSTFIEEASEFKYFHQFVSAMKLRDFTFTYEGDTFKDNHLEAITMFIDSLKLKSWAIEFYSEWADLPDEHYFMPVINDLIILEACIHMENCEDYGPLYNYKAKMGIGVNYVANEARYFSYNTASKQYGVRS